MASKAILERSDVVKLNLPAVKVVKGFNKREDLALDELVPQIVARGRVTEPVKVYKDGDNYCLITGHRRFASLSLIQAIQADTVKKEEAKEQYGLSPTAYNNAKAADVEFSLPAIIIEKTSEWHVRIESIMSNISKKLEPIEQGKEWMELTKMTLQELAEETGRDVEKVCAGRKPSSKVLNKDIADLLGFTESHVSQRLALVKERKGVAEEIRALVEKAISAKQINSNDGNAINRAATTVKEAQEAIDAIVEEARVAKVLKSAKGKVKERLIELVTSGTIDDDEALVIAHDAKNVEQVDKMVEELTDDEGMKESTPLPPSNKQSSDKTEEQRLAQKRADMMYLVGILDRQGIVAVRDAARAWANQKKPKVDVPWTDVNEPSDKKAA